MQTGPLQLADASMPGYGYDAGSPSRIRNHYENTRVPQDLVPRGFGRNRPARDRNVVRAALPHVAVYAECPRLGTTRSSRRMWVYALLALYQCINSINNILIASPPWLAVLLWVWTMNATPFQVKVLRDVAPCRMWVYVSWAERTYPEQASPRRQDEARPTACRG